MIVPDNSIYSFTSKHFTIQLGARSSFVTLQCPLKQLNGKQWTRPGLLSLQSSKLKDKSIYMLSSYCSPARHQADKQADVYMAFRVPRHMQASGHCGYSNTFKRQAASCLKCFYRYCLAIVHEGLSWGSRHKDQRWCKHHLCLLGRRLLEFKTTLINCHCWLELGDLWIYAKRLQSEIISMQTPAYDNYVCNDMVTSWLMLLLRHGLEYKSCQCVKRWSQSKLIDSSYLPRSKCCYSDSLLESRPPQLSNKLAQLGMRTTDEIHL